ncbi:Uncharacterized protein QTN25_008387 [Entamoeba marina]
MNVNCKPFIPTSRLFSGNNDDLTIFNSNVMDIESEKLKRKQYLSRKLEDLKFYEEELDKQHFSSPQTTFSDTSTTLEDMIRRGLVEL